MASGDPEPDALAAAWARCRAARPDVALDLERFRAHVEARRPDDVTAADQLATWCLDDLYLACAAVAGDPAAVRAFEREVIPVIELALGGWDRAVVDETRQRLRAMLLVDHAGRGPLLARYAGRGALRRWVRVVAAREAGKTVRDGAGAVLTDDEALLDVLAPLTDPALSALKHDAAAAFHASFLAALGELDRRERTALRLHVLDGLTIDEIAPMYAVHRATVARWIAGAKQAVLERTRRRLMHELRIDAGDVDSLIRLVQSRIELTDDLLRSQR
jgi:RNA polymerase sigma-70 factor (ECF subfamily)